MPGRWVERPGIACTFGRSRPCRILRPEATGISLKRRPRPLPPTCRAPGDELLGGAGGVR